MATLGRPRDPDLSLAAIDAALSLIVEDGYNALTMDRIAEKAHMSKAALYRRWPTKVGLVADAMEAFSLTQVPVPDCGRLRDDIIEVMRGLIQNRKDNIETFEALGAAIHSDPDLEAKCRHVLIDHLSAAFRGLVERASARGELPPGSDLALLGDLAPALIHYRHRIGGAPVDDVLIMRIADQFFPETD